MKQEIHKLKTHYKGVQPFVKVTAYELSAVDCSATDMSGYYGQETTLISDDPQPGYDFQSWSVTGSNVTGNNVKFQGDITAKANYSAHVYNVTLQNDGHGSIGANKTTGIIGDTITLSNTPNTHYHFSGYALTGAELTSNQFNIQTSDTTAKAFFEEDPKYNLTLQNDGHGTIAATKTTGYQGDTSTLSNSPSNGYQFSGYTVTGATISNSTLTFGTSDATAKAWFKTLPTSGVIKSNQTLTLTNATTSFSGNIPSGNYFAIKFNCSGKNNGARNQGLRFNFMFGTAENATISNDMWKWAFYANGGYNTNLGFSYYPLSEHNWNGQHKGGYTYVQNYNGGTARSYSTSESYYLMYYNDSISTNCKMKYIFAQPLSGLMSAYVNGTLIETFSSYALTTNTAMGKNKYKFISGNIGFVNGSTGKLTNYEVAWFNNLADAKAY